MGRVSAKIWQGAGKSAGRNAERLLQYVQRSLGSEHRFRDADDFGAWAKDLGLPVVDPERCEAFHGCGTPDNLRSICSTGFRNGSALCQRGSAVYTTPEPGPAARYYGFSVVVGGRPHRLVIGVSFSRGPKDYLHHGFGDGPFVYFCADASSVRPEGVVLVPVA